MGDQNENPATNPWTVNAVNAFSFFCCPECDYKSKAVPLFMNHAAKNHPDAKGLSVHVLLFKFYPDFIQILSKFYPEKIRIKYG